MWRWVTPVAVSNVSTEKRSEPGVGEVVDRVTCTTGRSTPCGPLRPALTKARVTELVAPEATVKAVAVPMVLPDALMVPPDALMKETFPVHEAAVPFELAVARFVKLTRTVSELASPIGGNGKVRVTVALFCAQAHATAQLKRVDRHP